MKIKQIIGSLAVAAFLTACGGTGDQKDTQTVQALDSIEQTLDQTIESVESEIEDMTHDVDSLLEGI